MSDAASSDERSAFVDRIAAEQERTTARIVALTRDFDDIVESVAHDPPDDEHDPEGATIGFERAQVTALIADARRHLADLEQARDRLDDGSYGICEHCGDAIGVERLQARPATRTCVGCAGRRS